MAVSRPSPLDDIDGDLCSALLRGLLDEAEQVAAALTAHWEALEANDGVEPGRPPDRSRVPR